MPINRILILDALTCAAMGIVLTLASRWLAMILSLPQGLLFWAGLILLPIALFMAILGLTSRPAAAAVWLVIVGNALWVLASLVVILSVSSGPLGIAFVLAQTLVVACFTWIEYRALILRQNAIVYPHTA